MSHPRALVIGAGIGGLVAALRLALEGLAVTVLERADDVGGKMRVVRVNDQAIDVGPTVLTMRWVFDALFEEAGASFDGTVGLTRAEILARHGWQDGATLDLHADAAASADAIGRLAGAREAAGYRSFLAYARTIYDTVREPFLLAERPTLATMAAQASRLGLSALRRIDGHRTLWSALGTFFRDARLRQLFARYATYVGSSPFSAPATLSVIAHVEQDGVYVVQGGMHSLARALEALCRAKGVQFRFAENVTEIRTQQGRARGVALLSGEEVPAEIVVCNGEPNALPIEGHVAPKAGQRSLSAMTFALLGRATGFPLVHHNVFFSRDYDREFEDIFNHRRLPEEPTVYVCAQDRAAQAQPGTAGGERLFCLINAPALERPPVLSPKENNECALRMWKVLSHCGLQIEPLAPPVITTPQAFAQRFPGSQGALYGAASHGMMSPFARAPTRGPVRGLYYAGGSCHPGAGVPMVALSAKLAVASAIADLASR